MTNNQTGARLHRQPSHGPILYESYVKDAGTYVYLAERANGPIPKPVSHSYIWGDALDELERVAPDLRIINLETSITSSDDYWRGKGINYRMHPKNLPCITVAKIDLCVLVNNHVLDWGYPGLVDTLETLNQAQVGTVGAGRDLSAAGAPAVMEVKGKGRVMVFAFGSPTSGIPFTWAATRDQPGINLLPDLADEAVRDVEKKVKALKQDNDLVIASIHWGGNWGYGIPREQTAFAHNLIDYAGLDVIHGHSSHHVKGLEVYRGKPIIYGCGDFLDDYEGISGYENFRGDLGLMYFVTMDPSTGKLSRLQMTPTKIKNFRVNRASRADAHWLKDTLNREGALLGTWVELDQNDGFTLRWA
jgi:poly-gamma-glutamate capsule biosynthesis protein CapA/YwtB (metallophosphatase superfamily)